MRADRGATRRRARWAAGTALALVQALGTPAVEARAPGAIPMEGRSAIAPGATLGPWRGERLSGVRWDLEPAGAAGSPIEALERETGWRRGVRLDEALWQRLADGVARVFGARGHLEAVATAVHLTPDDEGVGARVRIAAGPPTRFGNVRLLGAERMGADVAREALGIERGSPWSSAALERGLERLLERYRESGRPFTSVRVRDLAIEAGRADLTLLVVESDSVVIDTVRVEGLVRTRASVLERATASVTGVPYRPSRSDEARRRLIDLGVFSRVEPLGFTLLSPGRGELAFRVEEAASNTFEGVFGYQGESESLTGLARLFVGNLAGTARQADLFWEGRDGGVSTFRLRYREPFLFGLPLAAGLAVRHELFDTLFTRTDVSLDGTLGLAPGTDLTLGLESGRVVVGAGPVERTTRQGTRLSLRRSSGEPLDGGRPARGYRAELIAGQDFKRERLRGEGERSGRLSTVGFDAVGERPSGGTRFVHFELGTRLRLSSDETPPIYELFPLGGVASLRGYREEQFRASRYALVRGEVGWARGLGRLYLFLDQAVFFRRAVRADSTIGGETRYRAGYGLGASLPSGIGRIGVNVGWGRGDGPLDAKLHLRLVSRF